MPLFGRNQVDLVITAARYNSPDNVAWVRAYERRGAIWSDRIKLSRDDLIRRIEAGERVVIGKRIPRHGATFELGPPVLLTEQNGQKYLLTGDANGEGDHLDGLPAL